MAKTKFQARHYQDVALIFQDTYPTYDTYDAPALWAAAKQWDAMRQAFVDMFTQDNPLFDAARFNAACVRGADPRKRTKIDSTLPTASAVKGVLKMGD